MRRLKSRKPPPELTAVPVSERAKRPSAAELVAAEMPSKEEVASLLAKKAVEAETRAAALRLENDRILQAQATFARSAAETEEIRKELVAESVSALKSKGLRVRKDLSDEMREHAVQVAGAAFERMNDVCMGRVDPKVAYAVLKSALAIRDELCEPIAKEQKTSGGGVSLAQAVLSLSGLGGK